MKKSWQLFLKHSLVIVFIGVVAIPFVYILLLSFFVYFRYPSLFPAKFTWNYWIHILSENSLFYSSVVNTIAIGLMVSILSTIIGQLTGRAFVRYYSEALFIKLLVSLPLFIPATALFLGVHQVILETSLVNNFWGVCVGHILICIPYTTNISMSYYKGIPVDIEHVAKTLGANQWLVFKKVILPMMAPGITLSLSISFLISTTEYFSVFLIGGGNVITLSMLMYPFINNSEYGYASITGLVFILINLVVFISLDRFIKKYNQQTLLYEVG